jgi:enamine deaminase RidA (YjgF/YER057c/UK114 family)
MQDGFAQDCQMREVSREGMRELFVTCAGTTAASLAPMAQHLIQTQDAGVMAAEYFGPDMNGSAHTMAREVLARIAMPLTWVQGGEVNEKLGGIHLRAVSGADVKPLTLDGMLVGTVVEGPYAVECLLGGVHGTDTTVAPDQQARATFERIEHALALADMDFSHVARTWLFLDDILAWYDDFNRVRTGFFRERGVFDRLVPASTGIGGSNPQGAAMVAGVYAVKAKHPSVTVQTLPSPLQCPALEYGSSFSRAVEIAMPDMRRVFVSGTASIAPDGQTVHLGDVLAQTARTCEVVEAILQSRGMGWEHVTRATAYVRFAKDVGVLEQHRLTAGLPPLPVVVAHNVVCRDDLLFELELDAALAQPT